MDEKIYEKIARENGVSVEEVKKEMQSAINMAFENPSDLAKSIPSKGDIPDTDEVIDFILKILNGSEK